MSQRPELLIRRLGRRYGVVLALVAGLLLADQAVLQPLLVQLNLSAPVINLAGRQRMLSQSIAKEALALGLTSSRDSEPAKHLDNRLAEWRRLHAGLKDGDAVLGLAATRNPEIRRRLLDLDAPVQAMGNAVQRLKTTPHNASDDIRRLLAAEQTFLPAMDRIVRLYELDAQQQVGRLRATALAATIVVIALMAGLYWLVLGPAVVMIRLQVERLEEHERELEQRVDERTRQLTESHLALEDEVRQRADSEQRTLQLQSQLAHASRLNSLGELATGIAHELNQPLGAISNYAETMLLLTDQDTVDRRALTHAATRVRESAQRAGALIRRMRNFVRSRNLPRSREPINTLITDVITLCEPDLRSRSVAVQLDCDDTRDTSTLVDAIQIQQVLVNLLRNAAQAVEFRPIGQRRVTVQTATTETGIQIDVRDNGEGFPGHFDASARSFQSTKPDGLGLGLSISRSIVEAHGGRLLTGNHPNGGARVTVQIPVHESSCPNSLEPADRLCCR